MGRFTTPRRMGSTGWLMHAASRSAYNNRGSNSKSSLNEGAISRRRNGGYEYRGMAELIALLASPLLIGGALLTFGSLAIGSGLFFVSAPLTAAATYGIIHLYNYRPAQRKGLL